MEAANLPSDNNTVSTARVEDEGRKRADLESSALLRVDRIEGRAEAISYDALGREECGDGRR